MLDPEREQIVRDFLDHALDALEHCHDQGSARPTPQG